MGLRHKRKGYQKNNVEHHGELPESVDHGTHIIYDMSTSLKTLLQASAELS
jgi:hypothetical protein